MGNIHLRPLKNKIKSLNTQEINSMVTKFCRLDVSLSCSVFDSKVDFTKKKKKKVLRAILAKNKMKIIVNML